MNVGKLLLYRDVRYFITADIITLLAEFVRNRLMTLGILECYTMIGAPISQLLVAIIAESHEVLLCLRLWLSILIHCCPHTLIVHELLILMTTFTSIVCEIKKRQIRSIHFLEVNITLLLYIYTYVLILYWLDMSLCLTDSPLSTLEIFFLGFVAYRA